METISAGGSPQALSVTTSSQTRGVKRTVTTVEIVGEQFSDKAAAKARVSELRSEGHKVVYAVMNLGGQRVYVVKPSED